MVLVHQQNFFDCVLLKAHLMKLTQQLKELLSLNKEEKKKEEEEEKKEEEEEKKKIRHLCL